MGHIPNHMKKTFTCLLLAVGLFGFAAPLRAATIMTGEAVSLGKTDTVADDVYAFGANLMSAGIVQGDLIAAGGNVLVTGDVEQDLNAAGGTLDILGNVGDDLRIAGGKVSVGGTVNGDLLVAGGMVHVLPGAVVKGEIRGAAGMLVLDGDVEGGVYLGGGTVILNGHVSGTVDVTADEKVVFGKLAQFAKDVTYAAPATSDEKTGAVFGGGVNYRKLEKPAAVQAGWPGVDWPKAVAGWLAWFIIRTAALLLASLLALKYFRRQLTDVAQRTFDGYAGRLMWGFAYLVTIPILVIVLFLTVIGSVMGGLLLAAYTLLAVLAKIAAGPCVAALLLRWFKGQKQVSLNWKSVLLGVAAYQLMWSIPVIGWAAGAMVFLAVFGTLLIEARGRIKP